MGRSLPILAITQGDPAGIGPEILVKATLATAPSDYRPLLIAERAALDAHRSALPDLDWEKLVYFDAASERSAIEALSPGQVAVFDPVQEPRKLVPGQSGSADAHGALSALDAGVALVRQGLADALVTAPVAKESIHRHLLPGFTGHTDYLAEGCGLTEYGRDYLMAFLAPGLQVALLSTHVPLLEAVRRIEAHTLVAALECLNRHAGGSIVVAGLNPHAGEGGLLGEEESRILLPAVTEARQRGIDVCGPESADSLFARARSGEFDWVLALYHDQGLIAVKTAAFGLATNWTLGLPYLRTSVDHGTAFGIAGQGKADERPLVACIETTLKILSGELPCKTAG